MSQERTTEEPPPQPKLSELVGGLTDLQTSRKLAERAQNHGQTKPGNRKGTGIDSIELNELSRRSFDGDEDYNDEHEGGHHNPAFSDSSEQDSEDNSDTNC